MQLLVKYVLDWLLSTISGAVARLVAMLKRQKEVKDQSDASVIPIKKATTADEIDKAADDSLSGL